MEFECQICKKQFNRRYNLELHLKKQKQCSPPDLFSEKYKLKKDGEIVCEFCGNNYSSIQGLSNHKHKYCKKSPFVVKLAAPVTTTSATTNTTTNTDSHDTTNTTDSHDTTNTTDSHDTTKISQDTTKISKDTNIDSHDTNNITQYFFIYDKKLTLEQIKEINPLKPKCHAKLHEMFPDVLYPFGQEDTSGVLDIKFIKKSFNCHNPIATFRAIFFGIYTLPGNRTISLPNKSKPFILTVNKDLNISSGNTDIKIKEIRKIIIEYYQTIFDTMKDSIRKNYHKTHEQFLKLINMSMSEVEYEDKKLQKAASARSKVGNDSETDSDDDTKDNRISNEEFINMKSLKTDKDFYEGQIHKIIAEYFENESYRNTSLMKKHKVIVGGIKDALHIKPKVIKRTEVDTRPQNLEANLIRFCGGKPIHPQQSSDESADEDDKPTSPKLGLSSDVEYKFSDEE